uniref:Retrotransposon gag domain-containing protein n=1 Tax=Tanacetum cinerariifolium TaxID=118510 RepID=A0A6L2L0C2_TANCI|nr:hypothetical protein [Tanacetum cinerariifolium]
MNQVASGPNMQNKATSLYDGSFQDEPKQVYTKGTRPKQCMIKMGDIDINMLSIEQYMALTRRDRPGVVIPKLGNDVDFEIKSHFVSELRCDLFVGAARRWKNLLPAGSMTTWDLLEEIFIRNYCPPLKTAKKLEEIQNFKQGMEESLYQAWERFMEASIKEQSKLEERIKKFRDDMEMSLRMLDTATKNLLGKTEQLTQEILTSSMADKAKTKIREDEAQAFRTLEELKRLKINRSLIRVVKRMPKYLTYVKDVFSSKEPIVEKDAVKLNDKCMAALQNQPPSKENDPGSFSLPFLIGNLQPTNMMIEMVDMTMKAPRGIINNVLVQIDKFIFPVDFVIMDMVEDPNVPLILGRPLLATAHAQIDVFNKQISLGIECFRETHKEELELLLASDPQSSFMEIQVMHMCGARIPIKVQGSIPNQTSRMLYWRMMKLLVMVDVAQEADLDHYFEHVVSSSYRANPRESSDESIFSSCYLFRNPFSSTTMGDKNHIRTLGDYSKPSHEGYRNTIELPDPTPSGWIHHHMEGSDYSFPCLILSTGKDCNNILMFQQHQGESLSEAWTRFKDLHRNVPHHSLDLWLQVQIFYDHVDYTTQMAIDYAVGGILRKLRPEEAWETIEDLAQHEEEE